MNVGQHALQVGFAALLLLGLAGCTHTAQKVSELMPSPQRKAATQFNIARLQERQGNLQQAFELYGELYERERTNAEVAHRLGVVLTRMDQYESALEFFRHAESLAPNDGELLSDLGYAHYLQGDYQAAEAVLRRARHLRPTDPRVLNNLALALGHSGKIDEALALFRKAGGDAEAYSNLGYIHVQRGEGEQAVAMFNKALTLDPKHKPAAAALVQLAELKRHSGGGRSPALGEGSLVAGQTPVAAPPRERQELVTTASTIAASPATAPSPGPSSAPPDVANSKDAAARNSVSRSVEPPWLQEFDDPLAPVQAVALGESDASNVGEHPAIWSTESSDARTAESVQQLEAPRSSVILTGAGDSQTERAIPIPTRAERAAGARQNGAAPTGGAVHAVAEDVERSASSGFLRPVLRERAQQDAGSQRR